MLAFIRLNEDASVEAPNRRAILLYLLLFKYRSMNYIKTTGNN